MGLSFIINFYMIFKLIFCFIVGFICSFENEVCIFVDKFFCFGVLCYVCVKYNDGFYGDVNEIFRK